MQSIITIIILLPAIVFALFLYRSYKTKSPITQPESGVGKKILNQYVRFYQTLSQAEKQRFENAIHDFLKQVRITGIKTEVEDIDRVLIASAAIIPIFAYPDWRYNNIHEVLLYPNSFSEEYTYEGEGRNILGMVGGGAMDNQMIISKNDLRRGFIDNHSSSNTAIHEFVHLIDRSDGDADGVPNILFDHPYAVPWLQRIHAEIQLILSGRSDINAYGATNEAEFLAVASEYFFTRPDKLKQNHPELFEMLEMVFERKNK